MTMDALQADSLYLDASMRQDGTDVLGYPFATFRLSWVAYLAPVRAFFVRTFLAGLLWMFLLNVVHVAPLTSALCGWAAMALNALWLAYDILYARTVVLFTDANGVWVSQGLLPWARGIGGVKWRDVSEAVFFQGFWSWALRSYEVRIGHRFTNGAELNLRHVRRGREAVEHINGVLVGQQKSAIGR